MKQTVTAKVYAQLSTKIEITNMYQKKDELIAVVRLVPTGINDDTICKSRFSVSVDTNACRELPVTYLSIEHNTKSFEEITESGVLKNAVEIPFTVIKGNQKIGFWQTGQGHCIFAIHQRLLTHTDIHPKGLFLKHLLAGQHTD